MSFELEAFPWTAGGDDAGGDFACEGLEPEGFRVWSFRSVRDSGYVPLAVTTALVGREQSGKTTLLRALGGLDPRQPAPFSALHAWPRGLRPRPSDGQVICAAKLRFRRALRDELVNRGLITSDAAGVHLGRTFDNGFVLSVQGHAGFEGPLPGHSQEWVALDPELEEELLGRIPEFVHVHSDDVLPEKFPSSELASLSAESGPAPIGGENGMRRPENPRVRTLVSLVPAGEGEAMGDWIQRINAKLGSFALSETLRLSDDRGLIRVLARSGNAWRPFGMLPPARRYLATLDLRIATIRELGGPAPLLLLDAPGKAFKGGLKRQLRRAISRYADAGIRVVYTARLPFHIELQHPEQVLVLSPNETPQATLCETPLAPGELTLHAALGMQGRSSFRIDDVNLVVEGPTDAGILAALATLFRSSGEPALPEDLNIISAGGAFEVASIASFLARQGLGAVALFDSDAAGLAGRRSLEETARKDMVRRPVRALLLGEAAQLNVDGATIEDLFPSAEYLEALQSLADEPGRRLLSELDARWDLGHRVHVARQIRKAYEGRGWRFPKVAAAEALEERLRATRSVDDLDAHFRASVRGLFQEVNHALGELRTRPDSGGR